MGDPQVTMGFSKKMVVHDLNDLEAPHPFRHLGSSIFTCAVKIAAFEAAVASRAAAP